MNVEFRLHRRYMDDATLDLGWSYADTSDRAETGRWLRMKPYLGTPTLGWVQPPAAPRGEPNDYVFMTGAPVPGGSPFENDVSGGTTTLTSPLMDLSNYPDPVVAFDLWFVHFERDTVRDTLVVELSNDNGSTWVPAFSHVRGKAGWGTQRFYPKDLLPLTTTMRVRFRASDTLGNALVVVAIDNFDVGTTRGDTHATDEATSRTGVAISIAPNPAHGAATVTLRSPIGGRLLRVELFDALGERVATLFEGTSIAGEMRLVTSEELDAGWYYLRATIDGVGSGGGFTVVK
jgi:hypothetical protein